MNVITRLEMMWNVPDAPDWPYYPARRLLGRERSVVDAYLAVERVTCCTFRCGLFIDFDGQPWSDAGTVDEPWMTMCWYQALPELLRGQEGFGPTTGPWEESRLTWRRRGDILAMEDKLYDGTFAMRPVEVSLHDFARLVHSEGIVMADLVRGLRNEVKRRLVSGDRDERLTVIDEQLPVAGQHGLGLIDQLGALLDR